MKSFNYTITDEIGLHARPAGLLAKEARLFASQITLRHGEKSADAKKLMALMGLCVKTGAQVSIAVEGDDEAEAIVKLEEFFKENL